MPIQPYPKTASPRELQRHYRKILELVKERREPVFLVRNNRAEAILLDAYTYEALLEKARGLTEEDVLKAVEEGRRAHTSGRTKKIASLAELEV